ncbi:RNA dependent RNA polymerase-domain-containing protein [Cladorrhinum sp. PSN332]|nr:RNA dependent RNA polymerase-domain-containing protein [Cladorrhinum sp. PSN332]
MEVFMRNLAPDLTENSLEILLKPFMDKLNITDYSCDKRKKSFIGNVTFLNAADAQRFLDHHGEVPEPGTLFKSHGYGKGKPRMHPSSKPRLFVMGKACFCKPSGRPADKTALKAIQYAKDEKKKTQSKPVQPVESSAAEKAVTMEATELRCGHHGFFDGCFAFVSEWHTNENCLVKFGKWNLVLIFQQRDIDIEIRISYKTIIQLIWSDNGCISVTLSSSPKILRTIHSDTETTSLMMIFGNAIKFNPDASTRVSAIDKDHEVVAPFCLVYQFTVPYDLDTKILKIKRKELFDVTKHDMALLYGYQTPFGSFDEAHRKLKRQLEGHTTNQTLSFGLLFLLQALVHNGYLHPATVSALAEKLAKLFSQAKANGDNQPPISNETFKKLFQWIKYPHPDSDPQNIDPGGIMEYLVKEEEIVRERPALQSKLLTATGTRTLIFRAAVTPSRITFHGPEMEARNRVLRKFPEHTDYFIRVQFCDEEGQDIFFNPRISLEGVYERFKSVLNNGIPIAGRHYDFLGFSHSSLRARSVWMAAPFFYEGTLKLPRKIIDGLGNFQSIMSPARRAARIGQAFSETPYAVSLEERGIEVYEIDDVENKTNERVFSDGVGTISSGAAEAIYDVISSEKGSPTCFQIRWAGAKGMLALDTRLSGNSICVRPSMRKFESEDTQNLEICDLAWKPVPLILNRQLIKILEDMGAPPHWFLELQEKELERLRGVTLTVFNTASFLKMQGFCQSVQLHKLLRQVDKMGLDYRTDPFLRNAIETILLGELRLLKNKSRIPVPQGVTLFGVMDETGFLGEGEVYVAHNPSDHHHVPRNEPILVSRSPALHPGDVQLARNVSPPEDSPLRSLQHCIVFSQRGSRDLPSQLSGGDLDGDLYHVLWDKEVVNSVRTYEPAEYPPVKLLELDRPVEPTDMSDFFIEFMKTDRLGVIASRHAILADLNEEGTLHPDCLKLAELHSNAVDFSKSGRPVEMKDMPKGPKWKPDFLSRGPDITIHDRSEISLDDYTAEEDDDDDAERGPKFKYYKSDKIIGQLFRAVDERKIWHESIRSTVPRGGSSFWWDFINTITHDRIFALGEVNWRRRINEAKMIRHAYNQAVYRTMVDCSDHPHKPLIELEVFIGTIVNKSGTLNTRQRDKSIKLKDEFERITSWITEEMRNQNLEDDSKKGELDALELCLACVHIGCDKEGRETAGKAQPFKRGSSESLVSFKIVAASALLRELNSLESLRRAAGDSLATDLAQLDINKSTRQANSNYGVMRPDGTWLPLRRENQAPVSTAQGLSRSSESHAAGVDVSGQQQQHAYLGAQAGAQAGLNVYPQLFR